MIEVLLFIYFTFNLGILLVITSENKRMGTYTTWKKMLPEGTIILLFGVPMVIWSFINWKK